MGNVNKHVNVGVSLTKSGTDYVVKIDSILTNYKDYLTALRAFTVAFKARNYGHSSTNFYIALDGTAPVGGSDNVSGSTGDFTGGGLVPTTTELVTALKADPVFMAEVEGDAGLPCTPGQDGEDVSVKPIVYCSSDTTIAKEVGLVIALHNGPTANITSVINLALP